MSADEIIDALYGLPLAEFTQARNDAVKELRAEGRRDEAERVKALRKPSAAAAAVNRLVRAHRDEVEDFLDAAAKLRDAQFAGKGDLDEARKRERDALTRLVGLGGDAVRQSLLAAAVDDEAAGQLLAGRLERELEPRGFGTLLAHVPPSAKPKARQRPDDRKARAELEDAERALTAAAAEERQARRHWEETQRELEKAQAAVEAARRNLERIRNEAG